LIDTQIIKYLWYAMVAYHKITLIYHFNSKYFW